MKKRPYQRLIKLYGVDHISNVLNIRARAKLALFQHLLVLVQYD